MNQKDQADTTRVIAHADLLRSVDRLLTQAETVREKRKLLGRLLSETEIAAKKRPEAASCQ